MELPQPDSFDNWKDWARQTSILLRKIKDVDNTEGPPQETTKYVGTTGGPPFLNGWKNSNAYFPTGFWKVDGIVYLTGGAVKNPVSLVPIFVLPEGYRPRPILSNWICNSMLVQIDWGGSVVRLSGAASGVFNTISFPAQNITPG